ncbi:MAG: hypothetical protein BroJett003_16140 [Planctomycetota bacterium]|nr:MAG: hypothetical protein BroJett003_16140 [Planctomycetota bacterium]
MRTAPYAILFVIIRLGIILLPLPTLLMTAGGLALVCGIVLLILAPSYAVLAFLAGAALLVIGSLMQRRIDRREVEQIEADAKNYTRRNQVWVDRRDR